MSIQTFTIQTKLNIRKSVLNLKNIHYSSIRSFPPFIRESERVELNRVLDNDQSNNLDLVVLNRNSNIDSYSDLNKVDNLTSYKEAFPWLVIGGVDKDFLINLEEKVTVFKAVEYVSNYLDKRLEVNPDEISNKKLTEILKPFLNNKDVSVRDLFNHIKSIHDKIPDFLNNNVVKEIEWTSKNIDVSKPLGEIGDVTLNQLITTVNEMNLKDFIFVNKRILINTLPTAINLISYGSVMWTYINKVKNRPIPSYINTATLLELHLKRREIQLAIFSVLGAPLIVSVLRHSAIPLKDMVSIELIGGNETNVTNTTRVNNNKGIFLILVNKIINYIPYWIKFALILIFILILLIKIIGIENFLNTFVLGKTIYFKWFGYFSCSFVILFNLLNLYLIHKFSQSDIKVSKLFPDFLINWLNDFKIISANEDSIKFFKDMYYRDIIVYLVIIVIITLFL